MIGPTGAVKVMVATKPVDFRKGAEGLAALVRGTLGADPFSGAVYVFRAKHTDRIKLIFWDGTGVCLYAKRLEDGEFRWPKVHDGVMRLTAAQFGHSPLRPLIMNALQPLSSSVMRTSPCQWGGAPAGRAALRSRPRGDQTAAAGYELASELPLFTSLGNATHTVP
ncbi:hypothetical protein B5V01_16655 [Mesorhizobium erdmanii]|uniref:Transposase n=2 Tax=Mesorhizobium TaxID=68287 RepID=A0A3M9X3M1_9HYPH|nr:MULTISPECIES: IS66 family insertion sequence element accessory protein TnpB [Mesorhizobium]RNJ42624.1 hypothetical protein DNR46_28140 [Mesorhizobium japonicum]RXT44756.1 hypothetical protein B5V01_16655 [Mesorhizobium erdmanii]